eukprot:184312-Rhodomonas_salina.1
MSGTERAYAASTFPTQCPVLRLRMLVPYPTRCAVLRLRMVLQGYSFKQDDQGQLKSIRMAELKAGELNSFRMAELKSFFFFFLSGRGGVRCAAYVLSGTALADNGQTDGEDTALTARITGNRRRRQLQVQLYSEFKPKKTAKQLYPGTDRAETAVVVLQNNKTNEHGDYTFTGLEPGTYFLRPILKVQFKPPAPVPPLGGANRRYACACRSTSSARPPTRLPSRSGRRSPLSAYAAFRYPLRASAAVPLRLPPLGRYALCGTDHAHTVALIARIR